MARVFGVGGVFLRSPDPARLTRWYAEHLHIALTDFGGLTFASPEAQVHPVEAPIWSAFPEDTPYLGTREGAPQQVMINYRVDDLGALLEELTAAGVWIDPHRESSDFGHFAWIRDCDGNRLELWQALPSDPSSH